MLLLTGLCLFFNIKRRSDHEIISVRILFYYFASSTEFRYLYLSFLFDLNLLLELLANRLINFDILLFNTMFCADPDLLTDLMAGICFIIEFICICFVFQIFRSLVVRVPILASLIDRLVSRYFLFPDS